MGNRAASVSLATGDDKMGVSTCSLQTKSALTDPRVAANINYCSLADRCVSCMQIHESGQPHNADRFLFCMA